ncbi:phage tail tip fiber protein [Vreelandella populi]|uniref:phage tail tip fiber protein n=1 Tax=Vreelandella populi TaxID=2498858 RepID=UPI000F8CBA6C|nr:phage tail protein [Halomonas populi]RUR38567.1 DUF1983 domain-containing protein [Halomonas populi]
MSKAIKSVTKAVTGVFDAVLKPVQKVIGKLFGVPDVPNYSSGNSATELKQIVKSSKEPARYVFGHIGVGGLQSWAQEQDGDQTEGEELYQVFALTEGSIERIDNVFLDQNPIADAGDRASYALLKNMSQADPYLLARSPGWRDTMIGRGLSAVRLTLRYDPEYFETGLPTPLVELHGRNDIYDPRTGGYGYSDNVALVILWYVRNRLGVPDDEILWDSFREAANICDEWIINPDGSGERRYTMAGGFKADERKDRVLADLEAACAGTLLRIGGKFGLLVGAYYGPYDFTIDESMVIGPVSGQTEVSRADAVNTMRGKFVDPSQRWAETDYPPVVVDEWVAEDGGPIEDSLDLRFVTSAYQAQRLANIALRRKRAGGTLRIPLNFRGYACRPGRVIRVNLPTINVDGEFRVVNWEFSGTEGCVVTLQQEQAEIYDDAVGQPFDPFGFISLPAGGIGSPTGLRYVLESVGEVIQGRLYWNPVDAALHYNVVIKHDGLAVQSAQVPAGVERCDIGGLEAGQYTAEVRARGRLGLSGPSGINFTINVPATPERVIFTRGNREVTLIPQLPPGASLGGGYYRFYWTPSEGATQPQSQYLGDGLTFAHTGLAPATRYYYYVQSVNAYGASPFLRVDVETTNNFQEEFELIEADLRKPGGIIYQIEEGLDGLIETVDGYSESIEKAEKEAGDALKAALDAVKSGELNSLEQEVRLSTIQAQIALANAVMDVEHSVRVAEEFALAQRITTMGVTFNGRVASIEEELTVFANEQLALSQSITKLTSTVGENTASIEDTRKTITLNELAQALENSVIQAKNTLGSAVVDVEHVVRVDEERALAQQITDVGIEFEGETASVRQELAAVYDPVTGAVAQAVTTVNVNGVLGVLGIQVAGGEAQIIGVADKFAIFNPINGQLVTAFVVTDGRVIMPEAFIDALTITKLRSSTGSLVFQDDRLQAAYIAVDQLRVKWAQIEDVWVTNAQIANLAVDNAKLANASIDTLKIRGEAVTIGVSSHADAWVTVPFQADIELARVTFNPEGGRIKLTFGFIYRPPWAPNAGFGSVSVSIRRDGTQVRDFNFGYNGGQHEAAFPSTVIFTDWQSSNQPVTYTIIARGFNVNHQLTIRNRTLIAESLRR